MTAIHEQKRIYRGLISKIVVDLYDEDPGGQRLLFLFFVTLALGFYSLPKLRSWWTLLTGTELALDEGRGKG